MPGGVPAPATAAEVALSAAAAAVFRFDIALSAGSVDVSRIKVTLDVHFDPR